MKIALIGYGAMGKLVKRLAEEKGHQISVIVQDTEADLSAENLAERLKSIDVAIDFSAASAVRRNVEACMLAGVPLVEGTTGWNVERDAIERLVTKNEGSMVFGANFSVGVNLFYKIANYAAELLAKFPDYEAFIEEQHHSRKKDAPSGTALKLKEITEQYVKKDFSISSTRAGNIPGTHRVGFDGPADQILLEHRARSREGFATGALLAAEWIIGKKGVYEFSQIIDEILK
jgi:Dihydrodipicolinate reductase